MKNLFFIIKNIKKNSILYTCTQFFPKNNKKKLGLICIALLGVAMTHNFLKKKEQNISLIAIEKCIKCLPKGEYIFTIKEVGGGFSNDLWKIKTKLNSYILRSPKIKMSPANFLQDLAISKHAFKQGISPRVIDANLEDQCMLLEYIEHSPWPSYDENPEPYKATMKALKQFHDNMHEFTAEKKESFYAPFTFIFNESDKLVKSPKIPIHFALALKKIENLYKQIKPWLKNHATLCHGDFHQGNVLLSKSKNLTPILIDFDSVVQGDPIFDVVKFSVPLTQEQRLEMFSEYLGRSPPTTQELKHFELIDLTLLMIIATVRFQSTQDIQETFVESLSKNEMEEMLNSQEPLPSFLTIPFGNISPKARQLGAVYALSEFLKRCEAFTLNEI